MRNGYNIGRYLVFPRPRARRWGRTTRRPFVAQCSIPKSVSISRNPVVSSLSSFGNCDCSLGDALTPVYHRDKAARGKTAHKQDCSQQARSKHTATCFLFHSDISTITCSSYKSTAFVFRVLEVWVSFQTFHWRPVWSGIQESHKESQEPTK